MLPNVPFMSPLLDDIASKAMIMESALNFSVLMSLIILL